MAEQRTPRWNLRMSGGSGQVTEDDDSMDMQLEEPEEASSPVLTPTGGSSDPSAPGSLPAHGVPNRKPNAATRVCLATESPVLRLRPTAAFPPVPALIGKRRPETEEAPIKRARTASATLSDQRHPSEGSAPSYGSSSFPYSSPFSGACCPVPSISRADPEKVMWLQDPSSATCLVPGAQDSYCALFWPSVATLKFPRRRHRLLRPSCLQAPGGLEIRMIIMRPLLFLLLAVAMTVSLPDTRRARQRFAAVALERELHQDSDEAPRILPGGLPASGAACPRKGFADNLDHECKLFGLAGSGRVCDGLVSIFKAEFFDVMKRTSLSAHEVCSSVLGRECGDKGELNWTIALPNTRKPDPVPPKPKADAPKLRFLHITDTHVDMRYAEGSRADCPEILCCREDSGKAKIRAGHWGDLHRCDLPARTFESMLQEVRDHHKSREGNIALAKYTADSIAKFLPGVPVYPAVGNHEVHPVHCFPLPEEKGNMSAAWIFDALADQWSRWPSPSATDTVRSCLSRNATDPAQQLAWLVDELHESEGKGEKVHIIAHVPPGVYTCLHVWSENYHRILERYESTVRGQFFGHLHKDELEVAYDSTDAKRALGVAYLGPSLDDLQLGAPSVPSIHCGRRLPWSVLVTPGSPHVPAELDHGQRAS
ncbi:hypothetical protein MTO96_008644 [Rhipicephalus appendiculatus]